MAYYLDLFFGDPASGAGSILPTIAGTSTRVDVTDVMATVRRGPWNYLTNTDLVLVVAASAAQCNVTYVGIYGAASGGSPLYSARIGAFQTIAKGNPVAFQALNLAFSQGLAPVTLTIEYATNADFVGSLTVESAMITEGGVLMVTEGGSTMVTQ